MWECREGKIEVVGQLAILELWWFRECIPNSLQVSDQRCLEIRQRSCPDVVANDEQKERALIHTRRRQISKLKMVINSANLSCDFFPNNPRFTSNTVLRRPMLAP